MVESEMTLAGALKGRKTWLAAIGLGSFGVGEAYASQFAIAIPCLLVTLVLYRLMRARTAPAMTL